MRSSTRTVFTVALACAAAVASAQAYPTKPIRFIVTTTPGSPADILARAIGDKLAAAWGQPVLVENRAGATGTIGMEAIAKAPPDGYTFGFMFFAHTVAASIYSRLPYDTAKDLAPVTQCVWLYDMLAVPARSSVGTVQELLANAKSSTGTSKLTFASGGNGAPGHIAGVYLMRQGGISMDHVPFKGPAAAMQALLGEQVSMIFAPTSTVAPHLSSGRVRPLAVTSRQRLAAFPELPTIAEAGMLGFEVRDWQGMVAPSSTPRELIALMNAEVVRILALADVRDRVAALGMETVGGTPQSFGTLIRSELERWAKVVREANIKAD